MRMTIAFCVLLGVFPQLAEAQIPPRGTEIPAFEAVGPSERQERCQRAAADLMTADGGWSLEGIQPLSHCEVSGVPVLQRLWRLPYLTEKDLTGVMTITMGIQDRRLLRLAGSIALDAEQPDLTRFAGLNVVSEYLKPGSGHSRPGDWYDEGRPGVLQVTRRMNPTWVRGPEPITEEDLRALRPTLEELAAREEDPVRPIAEYLLSLLPKG